MIPQTTTPLTKLIRTTEGWLVVIANGALIVVPIVTSAVPASLAMKLGVILNGTTLVARTMLKTIAALSPLAGAATVPEGFNATESKTNEFGLTEEDMQLAPGEDFNSGALLVAQGTPADQIVSAGAPTEGPPPSGEHDSSVSGSPDASGQPESGLVTG